MSVNKNAVDKCRISDSTLEQFVSYGDMPIANGFLSEEEFKTEYYFPLEVAFCQKSKMVQLITQPDPEIMFHDHYAFFSSLSTSMQKHFKVFAEELKSRFVTNSNKMIMELGCNDGIFLQHFKDYRHLGIEPSLNVAEVSRSKGLRVENRFFGKALAEEIVSREGHVDLFSASNCMCHIPDFLSVLSGIDVLLSKKGVVVFEDPYMGAVVEKTSYDQFYDEHVFLFSLHSISYAFSLFGMEVFDVAPQVTHGGSMRYYICRKGEYQVAEAVTNLLEKEKLQGLDKIDVYLQFAKNCADSKSKLLEELSRLSKEGKKVVGYGATSKSTTVLNYCQIGPDLISYISDTTPIKIGKFSPGMHIPIRSYEDFKSSYPDVAVLFAWNHQTEIFEKEKAFRDGNGKWLFFVPQVEIV
jgi:SAM-dependent methyltransferase